MASTVDDIAKKVESLKRRSITRDRTMADIRAIRRGDAEAVMPGTFPDTWPKPIVANFIDVTARDLAEVIAPLPSVNCSSGNTVSERAKKFTAKRTKIANSYVQASNLSTEMFNGADQYITYAFLPFCVYPDFDRQTPIILLDDPFGSYYERDIFGRCRVYAKVWREDAEQLAAKFPEHASEILSPNYGVGKNTMLEVVKYIDDDQLTLFLPERRNKVLTTAENYLGRCPVEIAQRPGLDADGPRGQFDDVMWVQLARARMALLGLEAAEKSVQAPLAAPFDLQEMAFGPDAILRTSSPEKIRRVGLELPQGAFAEGQLLEGEMRMGARYPEGRSGNIDASVVTGRGVQALMGGFDTQVNTAQVVLGYALRRSLEMCFELDEKLWPNTKKEIKGTANGTPFEEQYTASRDIAGSYQVDVTYGFASGMDPNRALVFLLQLRGDKLVPRDLVQRHLPMDLDIVQLQQRIDIEETNDALKEGLFATLQSMGILAQQGIDPTQTLLAAATVIEAREKGKPLHEAILAAFAPKQPPPESNPGMGGDTGEAPGEPSSGGGLPPGMEASGLPMGVAPGQAGQGPGGRPDLQTLVAGLTSRGSPNLQSSVTRRVPA